ncbi:MAG TPA: V4R domain-containing protein [bacterium]
MADTGDAARGFAWEHLGDIAAGRPNLGQNVPVAMYRLLQFTLRDAVAAAHGPEAAQRVLVEAGRTAGREFCRRALDRTLPPGPFLAALQRALREWGIGILRVERSDLDRREFTLTVAEDLDCSGLPVTGDTVCEFDEGFIAGIFREYTGEEFSAREVDCWASGDRVCRFEVRRAAGTGDGPL